ncbi:hypothetical protein HDU93_003112, partial [Gonapodya sp. JEL0774]
VHVPPLAPLVSSLEEILDALREMRGDISRLDTVVGESTPQGSERVVPADRRDKGKGKAI